MRSNKAPKTTNRPGDSGSRDDSDPPIYVLTKEGLARWTFLTNHSHVLILLASDPSLVIREVALRVGITERAVQRIIADLEEDGFLEREKVGRKNHYRILADKHLRHPIEAHCSIGDLLALINDGKLPTS